MKIGLNRTQPIRYVVFLLSLVLVTCITTGCGSHVNVTQTNTDYFTPSLTSEVQILATRPTREYVELATISTHEWDPDDTADMHEELREESAELGADAVIILNSGITVDDELWATGVASRFQG